MGTCFGSGSDGIGASATSTAFGCENSIHRTDEQRGTCQFFSLAQSMSSQCTVSGVQRKGRGAHSEHDTTRSQPLATAQNRTTSTIDSRGYQHSASMIRQGVVALLTQ
jgi:hypothetical protein